MKSTMNFDMISDMINNFEDEWRSLMANKPIQSNWEIPKYTNSQINKAGKTIIKPDATPMEYKESLDILNNWRSSHAYPLQVITSNLRKNNKSAIVVQRLKRLDSIIGKLERFPDMRLSKMQDLGGCRVIVDSVDDVYQYKNSRIRHIIKRENDYIQNPKISGYRSYHIVYCFHSDKKDTYNNMLIEIQFRTRLQHTWATAIEMMGIFTKSALKASKGDNDILRFFVLISSIFAKMEGTPIVPNTSDDYNELISEIKEIDERLNLISILSALSLATQHVSKITSTKNKNAYYLLLLNYKNKTLHVRQYSPTQLDMATSLYNRIEAYNGINIDVVLVSSTSFEALKIAYPNYFTDITEFVTMMRRILA